MWISMVTSAPWLFTTPALYSRMIELTYYGRAFWYIHLLHFVIQTDVCHFCCYVNIISTYNLYIVYRRAPLRRTEPFRGEIWHIPQHRKKFFSWLKRKLTQFLKMSEFIPKPHSYVDWT